MGKTSYTQKFEEAMDRIVRAGEEHGEEVLRQTFFDEMVKLGDRERIQNLYKIKDKSGKIVQFKPNKAQDHFLDNKGTRNLILKPRQLGFTTLQCVREYDAAIFNPGTQDFIMADKMPRVAKIFDMVKRTHKHFVRDWGDLYLITPSKRDRDSTSKLSWDNLDSFIEVGYDAKGFTTTILHVSEAAFVSKERWSESTQSVSDSNEITAETTPNKRDPTFYAVWKASKEGMSPYKRFFFEWWQYYPEHPELIDIPVDFKATEQEKELQARHPGKIKDVHLIWRRYKIVECGSEEEFERQYPEDDEKCFLLGESQVFPGHWLEYLENICKPAAFVGRLKANPAINFVDLEAGFLHVWQKPKETEEYIIGADPSEGVGKDKAAAVVLHRASGKIVARINSNKLDPDIFGMELYKLGKYYNFAYMIVECNNHGFAVLNTLKTMNYPNLYFREEFDKLQDKRTKRLGFRSSRGTKELAVDKLRAAVRDREILYYDKDLLDQQVNYVEDPRNGKLGGSDGCNDDLVTATYLAWFAHIQTPEVTAMERKQSSLAPWDLKENEEDLSNVSGFTGHWIK
jgi:hypothetical protein